MSDCSTHAFDVPKKTFAEQFKDAITRYSLIPNSVLANEFVNNAMNLIDRYYLPRPLFEDGEPVQFEDEEQDAFTKSPFKVACF